MRSGWLWPAGVARGSELGARAGPDGSHAAETCGGRGQHRWHADRPMKPGRGPDGWEWMGAGENGWHADWSWGPRTNAVAWIGGLTQRAAAPWPDTDLDPPSAGPNTESARRAPGPDTESAVAPTPTQRALGEQLGARLRDPESTEAPKSGGPETDPDTASESAGPRHSERRTQRAPGPGALCRVPALSHALCRPRRSLCSGPGPLCVGPRRSLCRTPPLALCLLAAALCVKPWRSLCPGWPLLCVGPQRSLSGPLSVRSLSMLR